MSIKGVGWRQYKESITLRGGVRDDVARPNANSKSVHPGKQSKIEGGEKKYISLRLCDPATAGWGSEEEILYTKSFPHLFLSPDLFLSPVKTGVHPKDTRSLPPRRDGEKILDPRLRVEKTQENLPYDLFSLISFFPQFLSFPRVGGGPSELPSSKFWTACPDEFASDGLLPPRQDRGNGISDFARRSLRSDEVRPNGARHSKHSILYMVLTYCVEYDIVGFCS